MKWDSAGNKIWTRQAGTSNADMGSGVAVDSSGNIYVTGYTTGRLDGNTNAGSADIFLMKWDSAGNKIWTRQAGTSNADMGSGVAVDSSGNIYVTGYTTGGLDRNTHAGKEDIFLIKFDRDGNKIWTKQTGTPSKDWSNEVAVDSSGNIYVTGLTWGGLNGNANAGSADIFLIKYDSAGNKIWTRQAGTSDADMGSGVAVDSSGNIYVIGATHGGFDGNTNAGSADIFLMKWDSAGNKIWTRQAGTSESEYVTGAAVDSSDNIYIAGWTSGRLDGNPNVGFTDIFLMKYHSAGDRIWTRQVGTSEFDNGVGVAIDSSGNIYVTGGTKGALDGNPNAGESDIFLMKFRP
jgi:Tfp pilus assembly protein PilZ